MKEKIINLLKTNKKNIIIASLVVAIVIVGTLASLTVSNNKVKQQSIEFKNVLDMLVLGKEEDKEAINNTLEKLQKQNNKGFKTLSYLIEFKSYMESNDNENAKLTLKNLIQDKKVPAIYKDMSKYYLAVILFKENNLEDANNEIKEILQNSKSNYYISSLLLGTTINIKKGDLNEALKYAELIINNRTANPQMIQLANSLKYYIIDKQSSK